MRILKPSIEVFRGKDEANRPLLTTVDLLIVNEEDVTILNPFVWTEL